MLVSRVVTTIVVATFHLLLFSADLIAQEPKVHLEKYKKELGEVLSKKLLSSVGDLRTGIFSSKWESWYGSERPSDDAEIALIEKTKCVFDYSNERMRVDFERTGSSITRNRLAKYFTTRESAQLYIPETNTVQILPPNSHLDRRFGFSPIDPRFLGLCTRLELTRIRNYVELREFITECIAEGKELPDERHQLSLYHPAGKSTVRRLIILDSSRNYIPLKLTCQFSNTEDLVWQDSTTKKLQWKQVGDLW
jgi:hypothetical protein